MTQEEIIAGNNQLIADFMHGKGSVHHNRYHDDWNELMPVLKKIAGEFNNNDGEGEYYESLEEALNPDYAIWEFLQADISSIYSRAIELIKLINKQATVEDYKEWEESVFERFEANPGLFNYEPTGSPDVENELQVQVREEGEQVEFFQIGYSEEENNFYFNHNDLKGNVIVKQSTNPEDLDKWLEEINDYDPAD